MTGLALTIVALGAAVEGGAQLAMGSAPAALLFLATAVALAATAHQAWERRTLTRRIRAAHARRRGWSR